MEQLEGKVALITGGASGIGLALVHRAAASGMKVAIVDVEKAALDAAVAEVGSSAEVIGLQCDVSNYDEVEATGAAVVDHFGALHLAINNAGVSGGGLSWEIPLEDWKWIVDVDLWGVIYGVKAFMPLIIASGGGHIVNTASMAGLTSPPFMSPYNVAKHGVVALSESMFHELAMTHPEVGVTVVCPGWVNTQIHLSERNRPADLAEQVQSDDADGLRSVVTGLIEGGLDPYVVAGMVFDAVTAGKFYVLTHAEWSAAVTDQTARMVAGENPKMSLPGTD
jgi:NAD(P)-dependent dehydrogenase (short-subunit alcohol dehydrogenase family)